MTNYQIIKVSPQQLHLQVRYTKEECPDYWINLRVTDFTDEGIHQSAQDGAAQAERFWSTISELPAEVTPTEMSGVAKERVATPRPDYDPMTQNITLEWIETDETLTETWTATEKTDEEKAQALEVSRAQTVVTPRQARLELAKRGLLANIDEIIALIPEPDKTVVEIEWEYAVSIERNSPWVIQLGSALGLDEEGLDELFKAAAAL